MSENEKEEQIIKFKDHISAITFIAFVLACDLFIATTISWETKDLWKFLLYMHVSMVFVLLGIKKVGLGSLFINVIKIIKDEALDDKFKMREIELAFAKFSEIYNLIWTKVEKKKSKEVVKKEVANIEEIEKSLPILSLGSERKVPKLGEGEVSSEKPPSKDPQLPPIV